MNGSIKTSKRAWCSAALCAAAGFLALSVYLHWSREITYSWLTIAAVCALVAVGQKWFAEKRQRVRRCGLVFGICFVLLQICGNRITTMNTLAETGFEFCWLLLAVIALAPAAGGFFVLFIQMVEKTQKCPASPKKNSRMVFWGSAALLLLCWLPYLLAFSAGAMLYVVVEELIPEMSEGEHSNVGTIFFAIGFTLMMVLDVALG